MLYLHFTKTAYVHLFGTHGFALNRDVKTAPPGYKLGGAVFYCDLSRSSAHNRGFQVLWGRRLCRFCHSSP